jgi:predicted ATPase
VLLVLDNFDHLLADAPQLAQLLAAAPHLKVLVTSRIALELSGEHRLIVLPLGVPPPADTLRQPISAAWAQERYPAVDLFIQRAQAVNPRLALTEAGLRAVGEICRHLDGLPLAIEAVAARATLFTPQELLARMDDRFALLTGGARDLPARHATLQRAIDWSYGLLTPAEQALFRRLSVFVGGCTLAEAQAVCGDGAGADAIIGGITALVAGSLLQRQEGADGQSRFAMLETVREYALSRLDAAGEAATLRQRHAAYYLALAEAAERVWDQPPEWDALRGLVAARDNLRAALRWALDQPDAETALRLNAALFSFWNTCSVLSEARRWLEATLALPRPPLGADLAAAEAKVWSVAGYMAAATGDDTQAFADFDHGLAAYRALGHNRGTAWTLRGRAFVHMLRGEFAAAEEYGTASRRLCEASGDGWGLAWSLYSLAFIQLARGDIEQARPALEDALRHLRAQNIPFGVFRALVALGYTAFEQGDIARAEALFGVGLALARATPLLTFVTAGVEGLGMVAAALGAPERAARRWGAAEAMREATDERPWPVFQRSYERVRRAAQAQLPPDQWAAAWAAGRALPAAQALAEALEEGSAPPPVAPLPLVGAAGPSY